MSFTDRFSPAQCVQAVALLATLAGVVTWSSLLLTRAESRTPEAAPQLIAERSSNPALQWFSNQPAPVDIKVGGVLAGSRGAVEPSGGPRAGRSLKGGVGAEPASPTRRARSVTTSRRT